MKITLHASCILLNTIVLTFKNKLITKNKYNTTFSKSMFT